MIQLEFCLASEMTGKDMMIRNLTVEVRQLADKNEQLTAENAKLHQEVEKLETVILLFARVAITHLFLNFV